MVMVMVLLVVVVVVVWLLMMVTRMVVVVRLVRLGHRSLMIVSIRRFWNLCLLLARLYGASFHHLLLLLNYHSIVWS